MSAGVTQARQSSATITSEWSQSWFTSRGTPSVTLNTASSTPGSKAASQSRPAAFIWVRTYATASAWSSGSR